MAQTTQNASFGPVFFSRYLFPTSVSHGCDKPQGDTGRGMEGWGQGMKKSTRDKPQPLWRVHG